MLTDPRRDPETPSPAEEARRAGYRDDCERCRAAVAVNGRPACPTHYRPIRERLQVGKETS